MIAEKTFYILVHEQWTCTCISVNEDISNTYNDIQNEL